MARLVAFGDAHLGRTHLAALRDDEGRNMREEDFLHSFDWAIGETLRQEPDGFLLLGDLFDHAKPSYRVFTRVLRGLLRLQEAGLSGVAISGNHDTPRLRGTGSPYSALEEIARNVSFAWSLEARSVDLARAKVHAVPQTLTLEDFKEQLEIAAGAVEQDNTNVLLAHVALTSLPSREWKDINELEVEESAFDKRFDMVVLGHYHVHQKASKRTWYAGSTDSFSFADRPKGAGAKGLIVVDTQTATVEHVPNPGERPLATFTVDAAGMGPAELVEAVGRHGSEVPDKALARVFLNEVDPAAYRQVPNADFQEVLPAAVYVQIEPDYGLASLAVQGVPHIGTLEQEWAGFIESQDLAGLDRKRVLTLGERFLVEAKGEEG
ncbi:MAG: metallophosphoesterase family protein [Actinomycetota bacterium]